ncbi:hypothetical protein BZA05DRAFT_398042 [Tricharina praecox]|uniref:uncharacterized protein n=1 Tax=Tricharina praecox TaxID=43433 RepID=UPI00221F7835|nr:uncharacterized protein BZA05DRAFT_398042 [Tricharina praecox]KAI5851858.1 hypothetical protein BZA05DRAFT_398042 [Tricharina praecox]
MLDITNRDPRTYNRPTADEIGVLRHVTELSSLYLPLRYVLLLIYGEQCWRPDIPLKDNEEAGPADRDGYGVERDPEQLSLDRSYL